MEEGVVRCFVVDGVDRNLEERRMEFLTGWTDQEEDPVLLRIMWVLEEWR